ncbi:hypothetical protein BJ875DRAFT_475434 [Amylocarpus encephaloides]|uniref:Calcofluor white hypersensitive protein n=1 Tax=Amylocarpus encephaloides TaxID=45428 RepID=A0A9P7Y9I0_9HELO|nr:hypothetical protein BJ875DRAFT_475434 [Amylocarpus encephaloides]
MAQPKSRLPLIFGGTAVAGVGYYLYTAGGSPMVAEKQFESDLSKASAKAKAQLPGQTTEAKKEGEKRASEAGAKVDSMIEKAKGEAAKTEQYGKDLGKDARNTIDEADRKIEEGAAKAKGGLSSWFGGK